MPWKRKNLDLLNKDMLKHCVPKHPVQKHLQSAFETAESGLKLYGTLKGLYEVGSAAVQGARSFYQVAAPIASALL